MSFCKCKATAPHENSSLPEREPELKKFCCSKMSNPPQGDRSRMPELYPAPLRRTQLHTGMLREGSNAQLKQGINFSALTNFKCQQKGELSLQFCSMSRSTGSSKYPQCTRSTSTKSYTCTPFWQLLYNQNSFFFADFSPFGNGLILF